MSALNCRLAAASAVDKVFIHEASLVLDAPGLASECRLAHTHQSAPRRGHQALGRPTHKISSLSWCADGSCLAAALKGKIR